MLVFCDLRFDVRCCVKDLRFEVKDWDLAKTGIKKRDASECKQIGCEIGRLQ